MNEKFETLITISEYMINLINAIDNTVEFFEGGEDRKGCEMISPIAEGIQWVTSALTVTKDVHKQDIDFQNINEKLNEIVEALENGDFTLIGDLFKYEIMPILEVIQNNINTIIKN